MAKAQEEHRFRIRRQRLAQRSQKISTLVPTMLCFGIGFMFVIMIFFVTRWRAQFLLTLQTEVPEESTQARTYERFIDHRNVGFDFRHEQELQEKPAGGTWPFISSAPFRCDPYLLGSEERYG